MRKFRFAAMVVLLGALAYGQQSVSSPKSETQKPDWRTEWRNVTVTIGLPSVDSLGQTYFQAMGTGVLISASSHSGYLVTARHVFCDPEKKFHPSQLNLRFAWQEKKSIYNYLGVSLQLRDPQNGSDQWASPEDNSDIAAIPMQTFSDELPPEDRLETYPSLGFASIADDPFEGESVLILGYPGLVGNEKLVRAIFRQGIVAWTDPSAPGQRPFLVDANLYPGNSGGPVLQLPIGFQKDGTFNYLSGGPLHLLGISKIASSPSLNPPTSVKQGLDSASN